MMRKILGFLFVLAAAAGFIFSAVGLFEVWTYQPQATQAVLDNLALFDQTLATTQNGLTVVGQVVQTTTTDVASLQTATEALERAIHDTNPMLDSLSGLAGKNLPDALSATQASLASAQSSALLIDNAMTVLNSIPFSPVASYKPDVPLHTALAQVSTSLDTLPPSLATISTSLANGKTNLGLVESELTKMAETNKGIGATLDSAQGVIDQYKTVAARLKTRVEAAQQAAPAWISTTAWVLTFILGWLLIAQLALAYQGLTLLREKPEAK